MKEQFTNEICAALDQLYPLSSYTSSTYTQQDQTMYGDVGKMISVEHAERVVSLLDSTSNVIYGGKDHNVQDRFVAPTVVEATADSTIMKHEIFGPILAIIHVPSIDGAIEFVNRHYTSKGEHPLAMYIFSKSQQEQHLIMNAIPSGMCGVNDVLKQSANYHLPFGGVGASGMNAYYGKFGFDFYSHYRGTLVEKNFSTWKWDPSVWMTFPPYNGRKLFAFRWLSRVPLVLSKLKEIIPMAKVTIPLGFAVYCVYNPNFFDAILELNIKTILNWLVQFWR